MKYIRAFWISKGQDQITVYLCLRCGALVIRDSEELHDQWHEKYVHDHS